MTANGFRQTHKWLWATLLWVALSVSVSIPATAQDVSGVPDSVFGPATGLDATPTIVTCLPQGDQMMVVEEFNGVQHIRPDVDGICTEPVHLDAPHGVRVDEADIRLQQEQQAPATQPIVYERDDQRTINPAQAQYEAAQEIMRLTLEAPQADGDGAISGQITDAITGDPVVDVYVQLTGAGYTGQCTDSNGEYSFSNLNYGTYYVYTAESYNWQNCDFSAPRDGTNPHLKYIREYYGGNYTYDNDATPIVIDGNNETATNIDIMLDEGATISGRVLDENSNPLADVQVETYSWNGNWPNSQICTDADGYYTLYGLASASDWVVSAASIYGGCPNEEWVEEYYDDQSSGSNATLISTTSGNVTGIDFELYDGSDFSGTVRDTNGNPVGGAQVEIRYETGSNSTRWISFSSNYDGTYEIKNMPRNSTMYISAGCVLYSWSQSNSCYDENYNELPNVLAREYWQEVPDIGSATEFYFTSDTQNTNIDFTLEEGSTLSGTVYDENGNPMPDMEVSLWYYDTVFGYYSTVTNVCTDSNGMYELQGLSRVIEYYVSTGGQYNNCGGSTTYPETYYDDANDLSNATPIVATTAGSSLTGYDFNLSLGQSISGNITDENGNPLENVYVYAWPSSGGSSSSTCSDANGNYTITGLTATWGYRAYAGGNNWCNGQQGQYAIEYWQEGYSYDTSTIIDLTNNDATGIDFTMALGSVVSGTVYNSDGSAPQGNVNVSLDIVTNNGVDSLHSTCVGSSGQYQFNTAPYGVDLRVRAETTDWCNPGDDTLEREFWQEATDDSNATEINFATADSTQTGIDFTMQTGSTISGTITDLDGNPLPNMMVRAWWQRSGNEWWWDSEVCTDANGNYELTGVGRVPHRISAGGSYNSCGGTTQYSEKYYGNTTNFSQATPVTPVAPNSAITGIDIELGTPTGTITGTVTQADTSNPQPNMRVYIYQYSGSFNSWYSRSTCTDSNGVYTFSDAPADGREFYLSTAHADNNDCGGSTDYGQTFYNGADYYNGPGFNTFSVARNATFTANMTQKRAGTINVTITDNDNDTGLGTVENVRVEVRTFHPDTGLLQFIDSACTDNTGLATLYAHYGLDVVVFVQANSFCNGVTHTEYTRTYYPSGNSPSDATLIQLNNGNPTVNGTIELQRGGTITGMVTIDGNTPTNINAYAYTGNPDSYDLSEVYNYFTSGTENGTYTIYGIPLDTPFQLFVLGNVSGSSAAYAAYEWWNDAKTYRDAIPLQATTTTPDLTGYNFELKPGTYINGTLYAADGTTPLAGVPVGIDGFYFGFSCTNAQGEFWAYGAQHNESYVLYAGGTTYANRCDNETLARQWYPNAPSYNAATPVAVGSGPLENLTFIYGGTVGDPDLLATDIHGEIHPQDGMASITFTIENQGSGPAGAFDVYILHSDDATCNTGDTQLDTLNHDPLGPGASETHNMTITLPRGVLYANAQADDPAGQGVGYESNNLEWLCLGVDAGAAVTESDETNNNNRGEGLDVHRFTYFPWDVNRDGLVNPVDVILVINYLTTNDLEADLDGSGTVETVEAQAVLNRLGYLINSAFAP